ncbi:MAG: AmmeMemoRadiSam system protein B [Planctomycetaceae bacterium]
MPRTRPPAVAGRFYPGDPVELELAVREYLVGGAGPLNPPKAVIVPHAGYPYSGPVAGSGYRQVEALHGSVTRVVLVGPAHYVAVKGLVTSAADFFETPLGRIPLDRDAIDDLLALPQVTVDDDAHRPEHSLEVQLPFLQVTLGEFQLVPLLVGSTTPEAVAEVLTCVWGGPETLIVVSSDLSHFHDWETATWLDRQTAESIVQGRVADLAGERACGYLPIGGLLTAARAAGLTPTTLDVRNSGDTAGPKDRVVGYGAFALTVDGEP